MYAQSAIVWEKIARAKHHQHHSKGLLFIGRTVSGQHLNFSEQPVSLLQLATYMRVLRNGTSVWHRAMADINIEFIFIFMFQSVRLFGCLDSKEKM